MIIIRYPAVAGLFYPEDPDELKKSIEKFFKKIPESPSLGKIYSLIVPHAGYIYSGQTAAYAYKLLKDNPVETIIIISPSHREYFQGISIYNGDFYRTPLGDVPINKELRNIIIKNNKRIIVSERGHREEHAIEVQLPFLQTVLSKFLIVPIIIGDQRPEYCNDLINILSTSLRNENVILIASTDLSHYHPADAADQLDQIIIKDIGEFNHTKLMADIQNEKAEACGGGPAVVVLATSKILGADSVKVLHHCNSGDITGDRSAVVGYLSAVTYRKN